MKFKTAELIARVNKKIDDEVKRAEERNRKDLEEIEQAREEWFEKSEYWVVFANRIKDKIRKGRPILPTDVPKEIQVSSFSRDPAFFRKKEPAKYEPHTKNLEAMKKLLESITDEEVTTTGLKEIGFKDIRSLFS